MRRIASLGSSKRACARTTYRVPRLVASCIVPAKPVQGILHRRPSRAYV